MFLRGLKIFKMIYINTERLYGIYENVVQVSGGGAAGVLDENKLEGILEQVKNDDYYPEFVDKLTHLFYCTCEFHCFEDGNKRLAITLSAYFLLLNGYMAVAKDFFVITENISYHVAAGKIGKELLHKIMLAILDGTYELNEELKLEILNAISEGSVF